MILVFEILGVWFLASVISAPVAIPFYVRRFARHDAWVKR